MVRDGRIGLDDPASVVLGDGRVRRPDAAHLLAHSRGMQSEPAGSWWERSRAAWDELAAATTDRARSSRPQEFHYTNVGYALLGAVVERVRGTHLVGRRRARCSTPLGMRRTSYLARPRGARKAGRCTRRGHPGRRSRTTDTGAMAPAGQLWATITDLARWATFLLDPDPDGAVGRRS